MAALFICGFDAYGAVASNVDTATLEWSVSAGTLQIVAGLSAAGYAANLAIGTISRTIPNTARLIGGVRFSSGLVANSGINFTDGGTAQAGIQFNTTGTIAVRNGNYSSGTVLGTSTATVTANSTHYLEWDITFANAGSYQLWLDGVSILSGSGDTTGTANAYANAVVFLAQNSGALIIDDLYLFDTTGSTNNTVLLTSPRVETTFPASDSAVQFAVGAAILGSNARRTASFTAAVANNLHLRRFTPPVTGTLSSISIVSGATNAGAQYRPVIYADSAGTAGTLMSTGSASTGITSGVPKTMALTTAQSLSAGTQYWIGFQTDTGVNFALSDGDAAGYRGAATFASGAPSTAPALTTGTASWLVWGNLTAAGANAYVVSQQPPPGQYSYVFDATVGHEDLYNMGALPTTPAVVHTVAMKAFVQKSDSGTKTVSLRIKSGGTDGGGSSTGQGLGTTFGWLVSYFPTDPSTSAAWTATALNAATAGFMVDS